MSEPANPTTPRRGCSSFRAEPHVASLVAALAVLVIAGAGCRHTAASRRAEEIATVRGHVSAGGPRVVDRHAFALPRACSLRYRLRPTLPGTDLDLCVVDSGTGRVLAVADGEGETEEGTLRLDGASPSIDVVVSSAWGASAYTLELEAVGKESGSTAISHCARKHTLEELAGELDARGRADRHAEEPADVAGVRSGLAWLAELDFSAETGLGQGSGAGPAGD